MSLYPNEEYDKEFVEAKRMIYTGLVKEKRPFFFDHIIAFFNHKFKQFNDK